MPELASAFEDAAVLHFFFSSPLDNYFSLLIQDFLSGGGGEPGGVETGEGADTSLARLIRIAIEGPELHRWC